MRRTWNSWTYYGADRDAGRSDEEDSVCQEGWKNKEDRALERGSKPAKGRSKGVLESAFEPSMANALERAMDLCDVRKERVARVKQAIASGRYKVQARDLAEKLVNNMLGEYH